MSDPARLPVSYDADISREPDGLVAALAGFGMDSCRQLDPIGGYMLIDPDCRSGKHSSCVGDPCECACHIDDDGNHAVDVDHE